MTDTNKEREIERLESSLINYVSHLSDTPKRARKVAEILVELGYGFLGDRVGQTFTEEGFRAWATENGFLLHGPSVVRAVEFAATLQPQQTMGREEIKDVLWRIESELHGLEHREQHESDYDLIADALLGKLPATSHPVEGELTHEKYIGFLNLYAEDDSECVAQAESGLWQAILSERAATEARVRGESATELETVTNCLADANVSSAQKAMEIDRLRATIAALNAKLETSVRLGDRVEYRYKYPGEDGWVSGTILVKTDHGVYYGSGELPRPTPKTLTNEEKAEAVMRSWGYDLSIPETKLVAQAKLMYAMLEGKSIDELYAEVAKGE
jgi:hypothetical protein